MENKSFCESLNPIERESFLEKLSDCNDIEYLKRVIEVCRSKAVYLALKKKALFNLLRVIEYFISIFNH